MPQAAATADVDRHLPMGKMKLSVSFSHDTGYNNLHSTTSSIQKLSDTMFRPVIWVKA